MDCDHFAVIQLTPNQRHSLFVSSPDPLRGVSEKIGTIQRRLAWPLRKDDTHKSRMYHFFGNCYLITTIQTGTFRHNTHPTIILGYTPGRGRRLIN